MNRPLKRSGAVKVLKALYLALGVGLLFVVVRETDLAEVAQRVTEIGVVGLIVVIALYFAAFLVDSITLTMALVPVPLNGRWLWRTWAVRMVGEAYNNTIPAAGMGGEPVKAVLLKRHYGVGYRAGTASLVLAKTINLVSLNLFLIGGFVLMLYSPKLSFGAKEVAAFGLAAILVATGLFFAVQRYRWTSLTGTFLSRFPWAERLESVLHHVRDFDERLVEFYTRYRGRFWLAVLLALVNWLLGVAEVYYAMWFLGHPITWAEAYMIEAVTQMVRAGTFFIPLSLGAQEGAFVIVVQTITVSSTLGLALGVVRRLREIIWIAVGFVIGGWYTTRFGGIEPREIGEDGSR